MYFPSQLSATPSISALIPSRTLQFNTILSILYDNLHLNYQTQPSTTQTPNTTTEQLPTYKNQKFNIHKTIQSWNLTFPGALDATNFLKEFEGKLNTNSIHTDDALPNMSHVFADDVLTWYHTFRNSWTTWNDFTKMFIEFFDDAKTDQKILNKLQRAIQSKNEFGIVFVIRVSALFTN